MSTRSAPSPATRRCRWSAPGSRRSICPAGRSRPTPTPPAPCIPTSRSIRPMPGPSSAADQPHAAARRPDRACRKAARQRDWFAPIVADAEAGFGGPLNCFEIMKAYIEAGAAGVHFEDQLASEKKCGHLGGKVLIPTQAHIRNLDAARLAADVWACRRWSSPAPTPRARKLITSDVDERDQPFIDRRAHGRGLLPAEGGHRPRPLHRARPRLRAARRPALVRDLPSRTSTRRGASPRRSSAQYPGQAAGLQLLAQLQLEGEARRRDDRQLPARARRDGLQVPVRHAGRLPQPQPCDVRAGARLQRPRHGGLFRAAAGRVRERGAPATPRPGTSARSAPAISTRSPRRCLGRQQLDGRARRIDRSRAVRRGGIQEDRMGQRYWVIGGHYSDCRVQASWSQGPK